MTDEELFPELPPGAFAKQDTGDDLAFYAPPRLVTHIDEGATAALTDFYRLMRKPPVKAAAALVSRLPLL